MIEKVVSQRREAEKKGVRPLKKKKGKERVGTSGHWKEQLQSLSAHEATTPLPLSTGCSTDPLPPVCSTRHKAAVMDQ